MIAPSSSSAASIRFVTVATTRQARCSSSDSSRLATIGMIADESAPAATSWKIRSGSRNAARNVSTSLSGSVLTISR